MFFLQKIANFNYLVCKKKQFVPSNSKQSMFETRLKYFDNITKTYDNFVDLESGKLVWFKKLSITKTLEYFSVKLVKYKNYLYLRCSKDTLLP